MSSWKALLHSLGFSDGESKIYLASLETGTASVQDLARKARVSRVTAYAAIESLMRQGLMSTVQKGKKRFYAAESPERLAAVVEERSQEMRQTLHEIHDAVDGLKLLQRGEKPVVKLFEGHEALKAIQNDVLAARPKAIYEIGNVDEINRTYDHERELRPFINRLKKQKPKCQSLLRSEQPDLRASHGVLVQLPKDGPAFNGDILVYANKVALSTFRGKQISVLIESQDIADTMRALFEHAWTCMRPQHR